MGERPGMLAASLLSLLLLASTPWCHADVAGTVTSDSWEASSSEASTSRDVPGHVPLDSASTAEELFPSESKRQAGRADEEAGTSEGASSDSSDMDNSSNMDSTESDGFRGSGSANHGEEGAKALAVVHEAVFSDEASSAEEDLEGGSFLARLIVTSLHSLHWAWAGRKGGHGEPGLASTALSVGLPQQQPLPRRLLGACSEQCNINLAMLQGIKDYRASQGNTASLCISNKLIQAAKGQAQYMARVKRLTHKGADGKSNGKTRMKAAGFGLAKWGENLSMGQKKASDAIWIWGRDSGHKANMLGTYNFMGVYKQGRYWVLDVATSTTETCDS